MGFLFMSVPRCFSLTSLGCRLCEVWSPTFLRQGSSLPCSCCHNIMLHVISQRAESLHSPFEIKVYKSALIVSLPKFAGVSTCIYCSVVHPKGQQALHKYSDQRCLRIILLLSALKSAQFVTEFLVLPQAISIRYDPINKIFIGWNCSAFVATLVTENCPV